MRTVCNECGRKISPYPGRAKCSDCKKRYSRKWRRKNPKYARRRAARLRAGGLCVVCAVQQASHERSTCDDCALSTKTSKNRWKRRVFKRGLCIHCGQRRHCEDSDLCLRCRTANVTRQRRKYRANRASLLSKCREQRRALRLEVFMAYGGSRCACCGETEITFLNLDHPKGDGAQHRRRIGRGLRIYYWLKRHGFPPGYRVLCWNCNEATRYGRRCPHELKSQFTVSQG